MIRIIVVVMNVLIRRKFCHAALGGKHESLQLEPSDGSVGRKVRNNRKDRVQEGGRALTVPHPPLVMFCRGCPYSRRENPLIL